MTDGIHYATMYTDSPDLEVMPCQSKRRRSRGRSAMSSGTSKEATSTDDVGSDHKQVLDKLSEDGNLLSQHEREE